MSFPAAPVATAADKRRTLREQLASGALHQYPGALNPLTARLIEKVGFPGVYVSGAVMANQGGLPDIGLTTLTEIAGIGRQIAGSTSLPVLIDADTGFGEPMNAARTIVELEDAGLAGCHLEDQVNPKRCGHLDGKAVVDTDTMVRRIRAAVSARRDENFVVCARTDARALEGLPAAIDRAKAYVDAGADLIFTEALADAGEFEAFRHAVGVPLLANMTEFGKSELLDAATLADIGYNIVIYPVTAMRLAMFAVEQGLRTIAERGTQAELLPKMQHRRDLYALLDYPAYREFDSQVATFTV